jgi:hypothetical protein
MNSILDRIFDTDQEFNWDDYIRDGKTIKLKNSNISYDFTDETKAIKAYKDIYESINEFISSLSKSNDI